MKNDIFKIKITFFISLAGTFKTPVKGLAYRKSGKRCEKKSKLPSWFHILVLLYNWKIVTVLLSKKLLTYKSVYLVRT
jgi:hypothetical protein